MPTKTSTAAKIVELLLSGSDLGKAVRSDLVELADAPSCENCGTPITNTRPSKQPRFCSQRCFRAAERCSVGP